MPQASPRGTYRVVADRIRADVSSARPGEGLASEAAMMRTFRIGRSTVRRALELLASEGLVESVPGVGWRVVGDSRHRPLVERLTEVVAVDELKVGDRFPSEAALCERFAMSRTAVRRALAQMEGQGLLEAQHGKGRVVRALPENGSSRRD